MYGPTKLGVAKALRYYNNLSKAQQTALFFKNVQGDARYTPHYLHTRWQGYQMYLESGVCRKPGTAGGVKSLGNKVQ